LGFISKTQKIIMNKQEVLDFIQSKPMGINYEEWINQLNPQISLELDSFLDILLDEGKIQKLIIYPKGGKTQCFILTSDTFITILKNQIVPTLMIETEQKEI
jgi:hypothetical protein